MIFRRLSIRWRITLGSVAIAVILLGVVAFAFYNQVSYMLSSTTETLLQHDSAPIKSEIVSGTRPIGTPGHAQLVAIVDPSRQLVVSTLPEDLAAKLSRLQQFGKEPIPVAAGDDNYLVLTQHVSSSSGDWIIIAARNMDASAPLLDRLTTTFLLYAGGLILGFAAASWLLTGAALRPVNRLRQQASELSRTRSSSILPLGAAHDEISTLAGTLNDFIVAQHQAVARERQMVSDASHELRSPIAVLRTQLELAHLNSGDAIELENSISSAERSLQRLSDVATSLLDLAEVESAQSTGSSSWDDLVGELGDAADRARVAGSRSKITVDFDYDDVAFTGSFPIALSRFGRLVDNLTNNAVHAMPEGGKVRLSLHFHDGMLLFDVRDTGPGVPEGFIPVAFNRFARPDLSRSATTGGSGLGLAIVKAIVADAGGSVDLANHPRGGLWVSVRIPESTVIAPEFPV